MPINQSYYICYDLETGGLGLTKQDYTPIQIAAVVIEPTTLQRLGDDGTFVSMMKPRNFDKITKEALQVNKKTIEEIDAAPDEEVVFKNFCKWIGNFTKSKWKNPVALGKNIIGFDKPIIDTMLDIYGIKNPFSRTVLDLENSLWMWFENTPDLINYKLDTVRDYMGISKENAHDALTDTIQTADCFIRFLKLHRSLAPKIKFKGTFTTKQEKCNVE